MAHATRVEALGRAIDVLRMNLAGQNTPGTVQPYFFDNGHTDEEAVETLKRMLTTLESMSNRSVRRPLQIQAQIYVDIDLNKPL